MSLFDRAAYRVRQLRRSLWPRVTRTEREDARRILGANLYPLFASMQPADQRHCLDVCERLVSAGCTDGEMLQAALIHDAGKGSIAGARFGVHHRVVYVCPPALPGRPRLPRSPKPWHPLTTRARPTHDRTRTRVRRISRRS